MQICLKIKNRISKKIFLALVVTSFNRIWEIVKALVSRQNNFLVKYNVFMRPRVETQLDHQSSPGVAVLRGA